MKAVRFAALFIAVATALGVARLVGLAAPTAYPLTQKWQKCYPGNWCETGWYASPAVADLDKDGNQEVLWGGYTLMAVNGLTGTEKWHTTQTGRLWPGIVVADLDHNGTLEVVTANGGGYINVYDATGVVKSGWPQQPADPSYEIRSLAVADIDANSDLEIIVCATRPDNQWFVYEHTGTLRPGWPRQTDSNSEGYAAGCYNENVGVADVDRDGQGEIIGPNDTHYVVGYHADGSALRTSSIYGQIGGLNKPWARVGVHVDHAVDLIGYANCGVEHRPNMANSAPTMADVNGDGTLEIIIVGNVYNCGTDPYTDLHEMPFIFNADRTRWHDATHDWTAIPAPDSAAAPLSEDYNQIENNVPNPVVADLDGDGLQEILYPSYDGRVHAYWLDKTEHGSWPFEVYQAAEGFYRFATEPIVADLNHDGKAEVIFGSWTQNGSQAAGKLYIVSWDGNLIQSVDLPRDINADHGGALAAPTIANIDADQDYELVIGTINQGLVAYDLGNSAHARILWGTGRGSYQRSGLAPAPLDNSGSLEAAYKTVSPLRPQPGAALTYTIVLSNPGALLSGVRLTDTLPTNAGFVAGSLTASSGSWGVNGPIVTWTGVVSVTRRVTLTYVMTTSSAITQPTAIINTVHLNDGLGRTVTRNATALLNGLKAYLPLLRK